MKNSNFAERVINFNSNLQYPGDLPPGFSVLNPFQDNPETIRVMKEFYKKFYSDNNKRRMIAGINPGRHGAGVTGIPFTDTKRLKSVCGIKMTDAHTHEVSSVFIYDMIAAYGGAEKFFGDFYINSPFPLAITQLKNNREINANYYDDKALTEAVTPFMLESMKKHVNIGIDIDVLYVMGRKNAIYLERLNQLNPLFKKIIPLDHPRFIQQYRSKYKEDYITQYLSAFEEK